MKIFDDILGYPKNFIGDFFLNRLAEIMFVVGIQRQTMTAKWPPAKNRPQQRRRSECTQQNTKTTNEIDCLEDFET